jgi:cobalt/nickel transport system ATP-binding protein
MQKGAQMSDPLIELQNVTLRRSADQPAVLHNASLQLFEHERLALRGANGVGKTSLLWLLVGLLYPEEGQVVAFGQVRLREADFQSIRGRVGLLFQDSDDQLFCPTVLEDVAFGPLNMGRSSEEAVAIAEQTLQMLELSGYEQRLTFHLSGGEKRLVALATVLAMQPEVLLLDEPTAGLDEHSTHRLQEILHSLSQAMIIVSHDHVFLESLATRSLELRDGTLA